MRFTVYIVDFYNHRRSTRIITANSEEEALEKAKEQYCLDYHITETNNFWDYKAIQCSLTPFWYIED
jgi:hypothetical protein